MTILHRRIPGWSGIFLGLVLVLVLPLRGEEANRGAVPVPNRDVSEQRLRRDVTYLASPECEGRGPTTKGLDRAADYVANEFKQAGLKPGNGNSWFQPFSIPGNRLKEAPTLVLTGPQGQQIKLKRGVDFDAMGLGGSGTIAGAEVVFAGYGVSSEPLRYDDYADIDVAGKVVVLLRDVPARSSQDRGGKLRAQAPFTSKLGRAERKKAAAVLFVNDADAARTGDDLLDFNYTATQPTEIKMPAIFMRRSVLEQMLRASITEELGDVEKDIDSRFQPHSLPLKGWKVSLSVATERTRIPLKNVVGVLEGKGPLAKQTVVIGAHYDHLGYGSFGSLSGLKKRAIHHGADDNGSGTTAVLELARRFAALPDRQGRRLVFMTFSGEELGLLGSKHYCEQPIFPLEDTVAMFNLDMVGRLRPDEKTGKDKLLVEGSNTAKTFAGMLESLNKTHDLQFALSKVVVPNSDHASFYRKKVPILFFWTGIHPDYHRPTDTADKINVAGMRRIVDLSQEVITSLATTEKRPEYVQVPIGGGGGRPRGNGPTLGVVPDYNGDGKEGMLIEGVSEGRPAAKAGIKTGDRIVSVAGKPVKNVLTYMEIMATQKKGDTIEVGVVRNGKTLMLKVALD